MADIAASVLARLKNKAAESGRSYQLCLQLFCQEEFLRRLEKSKYAVNLVLKGGLFLYSLTDCRFVKHMLHHQARNHLKQFEEISIPAGA